MSPIDRRRFLKLAGVTAGALAFQDRLIFAMGKRAKESMPEETGTWIPSCCHMCGGTTGILVHVVDGRVVKIEPNPDNPVGISNISTDFWAHKDEGAAVCPKGNASILSLYDPDRVKRPLKRTNPQKGKGIDPRWKEISWEEAIDEIAGRLKALRDRGEAHKLLWFSEDHCFTHIQEDFCDLYGTPNYSQHTNICDSARRVSAKLVMGYQRPLADTIQSRYILFFGWNPLSAVKWAYLPRIITRGIENGAKLVVVDPYMSFTATKAHEWIPIKPGTDGALALAMAHVIIRKRLHDKEFIDEWTVGFDAFIEYIRDKTPSWAEKITGVPAGTITRIATEYATTKPAVVDAWSGPGQHSNCVQGGRAIFLLAALTGQIDKPGTLIIPEKKGNKHQKVNYKESQYPPFDGRGIKYPFYRKGIYTEAFSRILNGKGPYMPKAAVIVFQNPVMAVPGTKNVIDAITRLEYVVVVDTHLSETAELADIVIPGTHYLERYDLNTHWVTWPVVGLRQPAVKPIFGQMPEYDFVIALGRQLGLKDLDGKEFFKDLKYEDYLSKELENGEPKITLSELKALPGATWIRKKGTQYEKFKKPLSPEILAGSVAEGDLIYDKPASQGGKRIGIMEGGKALAGFNTPSGKVEFYAAELARKKDANGRPIDGLPVYETRDWQPDEQYPLYLINWKEIQHTLSRTQNNPYLIELKNENLLHINTRTANKLGIKSKDYVWVESPYGRDKARARVTEAIHPEVVGWQHGFGHWALGKLAEGKGTNDSQFTPTKSDPISGQALHKECCVKVSKA